MPVYFIDSRSIQNQTVSLTGDLAHHLRDVLRCRRGETIQLVDETQTLYRATVGRVSPESITADILSQEPASIDSAVSIILAQALLKGKKMDWVIQKGTELGMDLLVPVMTDRSIPRVKKERVEGQRNRWQKIAREAAQQCGRQDIPEIRHPVPLSRFVTPSPDSSLRLALLEREKAPTLKSVLQGNPGGKTIIFLVGPEGGFSSGEIDFIKSQGWIPVTLGSRILRAETAGMAVLSALQYELSNGHS